MRQPFSARVRRWVAIAVATLIAAVTIPIGLADPAGAACPSFGPSAEWLGGYTTNGSTGSLFSDGLLASDGAGNVTGQILSLNDITPPTNTITGTLACGAFTGTVNNVFGPGTSINFSATLAPDGNSIVDGSWSTASFGGLSGTFTSARILRSAVGSAPVFFSNIEATPAEPTQVFVHSPNAGAVAAAFGTSAAPALHGYQMLDQIVHVVAPPATATDPLEIQFSIEASKLMGAPAQEIQVFRNGARVPDCVNAIALPDPCVAYRVAEPDGDVTIAIRTSTASIWSFGVNATRGALRVWSGVLPTASLGVAYSTSLTGLGGTAPYKWRKIGKLPKGLKLTAKTGRISGTPKVRGTFSLTVQIKDSAKVKPKHLGTKTISITIV
jgi:large repetitive protein